MVLIEAGYFGLALLEDVLLLFLQFNSILRDLIVELGL